MRLIYIAPFLHLVGGLERTLADKANYLVAEGHEVLLMTYKQGKEKVFYELDERVGQTDISCQLYSLYKLPMYARWGGFRKLRKLFRERFLVVIDEFRPDVVVITIPNTEDFIYDMMAVAQQKKVKVVVESHLASQFYLGDKPFTERLLCRLFPPIRAIRKADLLIALTNHDADSWRKQGLSQVAVVPNPLTKCLEGYNKLEKVEGRIIAVGRLFGQKRFDRLIDAFSLLAFKYPLWSIDIFGDGMLWEDLQCQIERLELVGRIRLNHPTHQIFSEYQRSEFFVLSSDFEGFGLVIIEAMACGIPVVSTDCPYGPSEIIEDGKTGLLAKMDVQDLADKMEWMIIHEAERREMGLQAHRAAARYKLENVMPMWEQAYQSVFK